MKAVYDGQIKPDQNFINQIDLCLGCRACEPACPAGVPYGQLLEQTRAAHPSRTAGQQKAHPQQILFADVISHPRRLKALGSLLRLYRAVRRHAQMDQQGASLSPVAGALEMERILPDVESPAFSPEPGYILLPAKNPDGSVCSEVAMDVLFNRTLLKHHPAVGRRAMKSNLVVTKLSRRIACPCRELQKSHPACRTNPGFCWKVDFICSNAGGCGAYACRICRAFQRRTKLA